MDRDKFEEQLSAILENKYDTEAWHKILRLVHNEPVENHRENIYEHLVAVFPTSGKFWKVYIEHEVILFFNRLSQAFLSNIRDAGTGKTTVRARSYCL